MAMTTDTTYLLGNEEAELARLEHQATMLAPATTTILRLAGIEPGMRVLDLGTGAGDVALLLAEMVGPSGEVIGVDQSEDALGWARRRCERRGLSQVSFVRGDVNTVDVGGDLDAVVGRLILLYTPDPAAVLRRFARFLRPGGRLVAMEYEMAAAGSIPGTALTRRIVGWVLDAFSRSGLDPSLGARLGGVFAAAGLEPEALLGLQGYFPSGDPAGPQMAAGIIRTLLPVLERTGIASAAEVDIDTLAARVATDLVEHAAVFKPPTLVGGWTIRR
jgi:hypothetical protein